MKDGSVRELTTRTPISSKRHASVVIKYISNYSSSPNDMNVSVNYVQKAELQGKVLALNIFHKSILIMSYILPVPAI